MDKNYLKESGKFSECLIFKWSSLLLLLLMMHCSFDGSGKLKMEPDGAQEKAGEDAALLGGGAGIESAGAPGFEFDLPFEEPGGDVEGSHAGAMAGTIAGIMAGIMAGTMAWQGDGGRLDLQGGEDSAGGFGGMDSEDAGEGFNGGSGGHGSDVSNVEMPGGFNGGSDDEGGGVEQMTEESGGSEWPHFHGLVINEVDYDQDGRSDLREFIEIYNASDVTIPVNDLGLEYINGDTGKRIRGDAIQLSEAQIIGIGGEEIVIEHIEPNQYLVVGKEAVTAHLPENIARIVVNRSLQNGFEGVRLVQHLDLEDVRLLLADEDPLVSPRGSIQNSPEGVRLIQYLEGDEETQQLEFVRVIDSLSYGGPYPDGMENLSVEGDLLQARDLNDSEGSVLRCPNGEDTDNNDEDFAFSDIPTPGSANHCVIEIGDDQGQENDAIE